MMKDLEKAKQILLADNLTCVLCRQNAVFTTTLRGVKPLVMWHQSRQNFLGFSAADKVVGKATAFLYVLLGVKAVFAKVMSKSALKVLTENNIKAQYDELVDNIINRKGDGICPFEAAVLSTDNPDVAYAEILNKMQELNITI